MHLSLDYGVVIVEAGGGEEGKNRTKDIDGHSLHLPSSKVAR